MQGDEAKWGYVLSRWIPGQMKENNHLIRKIKKGEWVKDAETLLSSSEPQTSPLFHLSELGNLLGR